jgi:hypothetical protein
MMSPPPPLPSVSDWDIPSIRITAVVVLSSYAAAAR